jgi:hypothetical protein
VLSEGASAANRAEDGVRVTEAVFEDLSQRIEACFDAVTLSDICERARALGVQRPSGERYSYVI